MTYASPVKGRHIAFIVFVIFFVLFCLLVLYRASFRDIPLHAWTLSEDWRIEKNGTALEEDTLSGIPHETAVKGDVYTIETVLPDAVFPAPALRVYTASAILDCYLDGKSVFSSGVSSLQRFFFVPQGYHLILLPSDAAAKTLTLRFTAVDTPSFSNLIPPHYGNLQDLVILRIRESVPAILTGAFLVIFGFLLAFFSFLLSRFSAGNKQMLLGGLCAMDIGLYALCLYNAFFFITSDLFVSTILEAVSQLFMPLLLSLFLRTMTRDEQEKKIFNALSVASAALLVSGILLQLLRIVPLTLFMLYFQWISILFFITLVVTGVRISRRQFSLIRRLRGSALSGATRYRLISHLFLFVGVFVLLLAVLLDLVVYQTTHFILHTNASGYTHFVSLFGMIAYTLFLMLSFFYQSVGAFIVSNRDRHLSDLVYTDALTKLPNRAYCERFMDELSTARKSFAIVAMDVNYLKRVNDTQGHAAGDELLKNFADVLRTSFRTSDVTGRLSGDEFIAIVLDVSLDECRDKMRRLTSDISVSISYGCAHSYEVLSRNAHEVLKLADERMYKMKQLIHAGEEVTAHA